MKKMLANVGNVLSAGPTLIDPLEIVVCIQETFYNGLKYKNNFATYFKESCW